MQSNGSSKAVVHDNCMPDDLSCGDPSKSRKQDARHELRGREMSLPLRPKFKVMRPLVCVVLMFSIAGCKHFEPNPAVYSKQKFALISFYGPKQIQAATGLIGGLQGMAEMGPQLLEDQYPAWEQSLQQGLGGQWLPDDKVPTAPSYSALEGARFEGSQATPKGLRAIRTSEANDVLLGKVASELGVDAVVVVRHQWLIVDDERSGAQRATDGFELLVVGADGQRLWYTDERVDGPPAQLSVGQVLAEAVGALKPDSVKQMTRDAVALAHQRFFQAWSTNKSAGAAPH